MSDNNGYTEQEVFEFGPNALTRGCEVGIFHKGRLMMRGTLLNENPRLWRRFSIRYRDADGTFRVTRMHGPAREWDDNGFMVGRLERCLVKRFR